MGQSKNWLTILFLTAVAVVGGIVLWPELGPRNDLKYCRVLFGPEAETEILLGAAADRLLIYFDGKLDGQPREYRLKNEYLPEETEIEIVGADGTVYLITDVSFMREDKPAPRESLMISVTVSGEEAFKQYCDVKLSKSLDSLKLAHFDGPLTIGPSMINWELPSSFRLVAGEEPGELQVAIGTLDKQAGCWTVVRTHEGEDPSFSAGVHPVLEVEYVSKTSEEPIREQYFLDQFC